MRWNDVLVVGFSYLRDLRQPESQGLIEIDFEASGICLSATKQFGAFCFRKLPGSCKSRTQPGRAQRRMDDKRSNIANNVFSSQSIPNSR